MKTKLELEGKVAIVTGAGRGIGETIAVKLAQEGADVAICDLSEKYLESVVKKIDEFGRRSLPVETDVSDVLGVKRMVKRTVDKLGKIDILVNNAGVYQTMQDLPEASEEDFQRVFGVNYYGTFLCCKAVAPYMIAQRSGKIVNISSMSGRFGRRSVNILHYGSSKAAVLLFTKAVARELAPYNINVNAICPGFVWTEMWRKVAEEFKRREENLRNLSPQEVFDKYVKENIPLQRPQTPEDIANAVLFLSSERSKNITGQVLDIDGGMDA